MSPDCNVEGCITALYRQNVWVGCKDQPVTLCWLVLIRAALNGAQEQINIIIGGSFWLNGGCCSVPIIYCVIISDDAVRTYCHTNGTYVYSIDLAETWCYIILSSAAPSAAFEQSDLFWQSVYVKGDEHMWLNKFALKRKQRIHSQSRSDQPTSSR